MLKPTNFIIIMMALLLTGCGNVVKTSNTASDPAGTSVSVEETDNDAITVVGIYTGQIDNNSIEVKVSNLPVDSAFKAFAFSEQAKASFDKMELNPNEKVKIKYRVVEGQQPQMITIKRTSE